MKRALLVEQSEDGGFRLPIDSHEVPFSNLEAEADSVEKISGLTGWEPWTELYAVYCGGGMDLYYFVREDH